MLEEKSKSAYRAERFRRGRRDLGKKKVNARDELVYSVCVFIRWKRRHTHSLYYLYVSDEPFGIWADRY